MKAVVVYESFWGNTAAIAREIAAGIGPDTLVLHTDEAPPAIVRDADLIVAGAPVVGFNLATERMLASVAQDDSPTPPDVEHPSLRSWLDALPPGRGASASFETRIWWSPRGATGEIEKRLERAGYAPIADGQKFVVKGKYGPLREGELERARAWGRELADLVAPPLVAVEA